MTAPVLDYVPRLDDRNRAYRVNPVAGAENVSKFWTPSELVLDQYSEGACVGAGVTHEYGASPVRGTINNQMLFDVYNRAKEIDEWEGVNYDGTSVRAGMLVGRERGWWSGFRWAMSMPEVRAALDEGPVVIGIEWRSGMYKAPNGILTAEGDVVGGHCILITGYTKYHPTLRSPAYRLRNSWGKDWGINGSAYIKPDSLNQLLFLAGGEAAVPVTRTLA